MQLTKEEVIKTFVRHILVDEYFLFFFKTKSEQLDKISVLKLCLNNYLILELFFALYRCFR